MLALALALYNTVELEEADGVRVDIEGEGADWLPRDDRNLVVQGARLVYRRAGCPFRGLRVRQQNAIPPARGLGSSASAWLAGILGANALLGEPLGREAVLDLAVAQEGHPDNVGAALAGGLAVTCWDGEAHVVVGLPVPGGIGFALLVPEERASTAAARAALPAAYPRADAVYNLGRVALLVAAMATGRVEHLATAMGDRLHQPYRARALFPWLDAVFTAARAAGALGVALSGAGPAVLALAREADAGGVAAAMAGALARAGRPGQARVVSAALEGARVERFPR